MDQFLRLICLFVFTLPSMMSAVFLPGPTGTDAESARAIQRDMKASVVIHVKGVDNTTRQMIMIGCSGTYISPTVILTAAHCFEGYDITQAWARNRGETSGYPVRLLIRDTHRDLALLRAPYGRVYVPLGGVVQRGEKVYAVGSPGRWEFVASEGYVILTDMPMPGLGADRFLVSTTPIDYGSSGGGLFNGDGALVGVNTWKLPQGVTGSVRLEDIRALLTEAQIRHLIE